MSTNAASRSNGAGAAARRRFPLRHFLLGVAAGVLLATAAGMLVAAPLALAHRTEFPLESAFGALAVNIISAVNAGNSVNPLPANDKTLGDGGDLFANNCSNCHGEKGDGKGKFINGYYPPPANLTLPNTRNKSDAQLFWIIRHGLSFTAMAAYPNLDDQQTWSLVAYIRSLK